MSAYSGLCCISLLCRCLSHENFMEVMDWSTTGKLQWGKQHLSKPQSISLHAAILTTFNVYFYSVSTPQTSNSESVDIMQLGDKTQLCLQTHAGFLLVWWANPRCFVIEAKRNDHGHDVHGSSKGLMFTSQHEPDPASHSHARLHTHTCSSTTTELDAWTVLLTPAHHNHESPSATLNHSWV